VKKKCFVENTAGNFRSESRIPTVISKVFARLSPRTDPVRMERAKGSLCCEMLSEKFLVFFWEALGLHDAKP